ncbi:MAG: CPBP family intramembrane metalloprotease [Anaerolineae bacterium]|nr:CPBP family intramembrane metalloprotease [Anaerolineae bacterium]
MTATSHPAPTPQRTIKPFTVGIIVLALSAPLITAFLDGYFDRWFDYNGSVLAGLTSFWLIVALVVWLSRLDTPPAASDARRSWWQTFNFKRPKLRESLIVLIIAFVTLGLANVAFVILARTVLPTEIKVSRAVSLPLPLVILAFLTGAIAEEILYRGYALERLHAMTGNWWLSGIVTGAIFAGFHFPAYPLAHIFGYILPSTIVLTLIYIWKRNLTYTVMFHAVLNLPILLGALLLPLLSPK